MFEWETHKKFGEKRRSKWHPETVVGGNVKIVLRYVECGIESNFTELCSIQNFTEDMNEPLNFI